MALSITEPTAEATDTSDGTSYAPLSAYTPGANSLQLVFVFAAGTTAAGSMSGGSLTWERLAKLASGAGSTLYVFMAQAGASPASCDPTFDCTDDSATGVVMSALEVTGHNQSYPIRQIAAAAANASNPSCPFSTALLTGNAYAMAIGVNRSAPAYSPFASSTETCDTGHSSPNSGMELAYRVNGTTSTSLSATGATGNYAAIAIEINDASETTVLSMGTNFRNTSTFVTDNAGENYNLAEVYPVFRGPFPDGWTDGLGGDRARDRNASLDRRLAGGNFTNSTGSQDRVTIYRRDLPCAGTWRVRFSMGDPDNARTGQKIEIFDDTTSKLTVSDASTGSGHFVDASGVERTSASDWVSNNATVDITFSTKIFILKCGTTAAGSDNTFLGHVNLEFVPPDNDITGTIGQTLGACTQSCAAKLTHSGALAQAISAPSQAVAAKITNSASTAQSIGAPSQSIAAVHHFPASVTQSIAAASHSVSALASNISTIAQAIGAGSNAVVAVHHFPAAITQSIGAPSQAATGALQHLAAIGQTLGACSQAIAAAQTFVATAAQAIGAPSQSISAELHYYAAIGQSISAPSQDIEANNTNPNRDAAIVQVLGAPSQAASAAISFSGTMSQSIGAPASSVAALVSESGAVGQSIGAPSQSATARLTNQAAAAQAIGAASQSIAAVAHIVGSIGSSIGAPTQAAAAELSHDAVISQVLSACVNAGVIVKGAIPAEPYFVYRVPPRQNIHSAKSRETVVNLKPANVIRVEREKL